MHTNLRKDVAAMTSFVVLSEAKIKKNWSLWQCGFFYTRMLNSFSYLWVYLSATQMLLRQQVP